MHYSIEFKLIPTIKKKNCMHTEENVIILKYLSKLTTTVKTEKKKKEKKEK